MNKIILYYDDDCPFCKEYSKYIKLRQKYDVELLNARDCIDKILLFKEEGMDINEGFIVEFVDEGMTLQGAAAVKELDKTLNKTGIVDKTISAIVRTSLFQSVLYPVVKVVRIVLLKLIGKDTNIKY